MQNLNKTLKQLLIVPTILICFFCLTSSAFAQTTKPPVKDLTDIMLQKRAALEVSDKALGIWGAEMVALDPANPAYELVSAKFTFLYAMNEIMQTKSLPNTSACIDATARLMVAENLLTPTSFDYAVGEVKKLLNKKNNPAYKENY